MSLAHREVIRNGKLRDNGRRVVKASWPIGWTESGLVCRPDIKSKAQQTGWRSGGRLSRSHRIKHNANIAAKMCISGRYMRCVLS